MASREAVVITAKIRLLAASTYKDIFICFVERYREGSWVFYRLADAASEGATGRLFPALFEGLALSADRLVQRDLERLRLARRARADAAAEYFRKNAAQWDEIRSLHSPDSEIERVMRELLGSDTCETCVDFGAGTGRVLVALADRYRRGVGYDLSLEMLAVARANLEREGVAHAQVRQGDLYSAPLEPASVDLVTIHQVLHYVTDPGGAVLEASRILRPGGRLLIVDFAPHDLEFLREQHAHRRLGFADEEVRAWAEAASLDVVRTETLAPGRDSAGKLTVKVWLLAAPAPVRANSRKRKAAA
ncbi:MAG: class I SAM-dependent methyltransferase [Pseudomonadota bacterium]